MPPLANSEPEPDIAIVRGPESRYATGHPQPENTDWLALPEVVLAVDRLLGEKPQCSRLAGMHYVGLVNPVGCVSNAPQN